MIIIGYQGIGKSTLVKKTNNRHYAQNDKGTIVPHYHFIDLESSCMRYSDTDERPYYWHDLYCNIAEDLSRQGNVVFTASHKVIRNRLSHSKEKVIICYPDIKLKDQWLERLKQRYETTKLDKDYRAYANAVDCFEDKY